MKTILNFIYNLFAKKAPKAKPGGAEMVTIEEAHGMYANIWSQFYVKPEYDRALNDAVTRIYLNRKRYKVASILSGLPWQVIAVIHYRESHCDFTRQLLNGQKYHKKTTIVPKGLGPWETWEQSCGEYELTSRKPDRQLKPGEWLDWLERYNGLGYRNRGYFSPYVFAGTNYYTSGLYVRDGKFNPNKTDKRVGCLPILKELGFLCDNIH